MLVSDQARDKFNVLEVACKLEFLSWQSWGMTKVVLHIVELWLRYYQVILLPKSAILCWNTLGRSCSIAVVSCEWDFSGLLSKSQNAPASKPSDQVAIHWFLQLIKYYFIPYLCPSLLEIDRGHIDCTCNIITGVQVSSPAAPQLCHELVAQAWFSH